MQLRAYVMVGCAALLWSAQSQAQEQRNYYCGDGQGEVRVTALSPERIAIDARFPDNEDASGSMRLRGGGTPSAGYRFVSGDYAVEFTGPGQDTLRYEAPDFGETFCTWGDDRAGMAPSLFTGSNLPEEDEGVARNGGGGDLPMAGRSCGGKVRSRPDLNSRQVGSLQNGDRITIPEDVGTMDGYSWFRIKFGSRTGYQWGGILTADGPLAGAHDGC